MQPSRPGPARLMIALLILAAGGAVALVYLRGSGHSEGAGTAGQMQTHASATSVPHFRVSEEGLQLGDTRLTRQNAREVLFRMLGTPTRTNRADGTSRVVYVYDRHGILYYSTQDGGEQSVVLDFDATGGTNGTESPFQGKLQIGREVVGAETDAARLAAIQELGLSHPKADQAIYSGRYKGLAFCFAYLKQPERLSLIEVDF